MKQINLKYEKDYNAIVDFVKHTQAGKYSQKKPVVVDYTLQRIDIQEQGESIEFDDPTASLELMRRARMTIGVDSGGVHLAAASGCSVLVLTHPKNYVQWLPITERGRAV